jgi:hypothetical protein
MRTIPDQIVTTETAINKAAATGQMSDFHDAYAYLLELRFQQVYATIPRPWTDEHLDILHTLPEG